MRANNSAAMMTGYPLIDDDHNGIAILIDELETAFEEGRPTSYCIELMDRLIDDTRAHFAHEERAMALWNAPDAEQHKHEHAQLLNEVVELRLCLAASMPNAQENRSSLIRFLEAWWLEHIPKFDRPLAAAAPRETATSP